MFSKAILRSLALTPLLALGSCQAMYFTTMETFGIEKREILFERIEDAGDAVVVTSQRIDETFAVYRDMIDQEEGDLYEAHERLEFFYESAEEAAEEYNDRISNIQDVATAMFDEWKKDSAAILDDELRRKSRANFNRAITQYEALLRSMRAVEAQTDPLLTRFRDHVLFMELNLNHSAFTPLRKHVADFATDIGTLTKQMEDVHYQVEEFLQMVTY